jgi:nucleotide-binding universal stress UspA family protein
MYTTLLVPIDGSEFSARALPLAAAMARRTNAVVHLALVNDPSTFIPFVPGEVAVPVYDADLVRERRAADQATLDAQVDRLKASGVRAIGALLEGTVVESLIEYGQQVAAELTVLSTHGRGGFERLRLGSVATALLARATTPVLLVHGAGVDDVATDAEHALPTGMLLCPVDGSEFSARALPHAANFAEVCGMTLELFSVTTPRTVSMAPFATEALLADPNILEIEEHDRLEYLKKLAATMPAGTLTHEIVDMSVGQAILEEATRIRAGAIAVTTHGRGGLARLVLGSTADEVIRHTTLPVLVYRPEPSK